jgi:hypothetical protein
VQHRGAVADRHTVGDAAAAGERGLKLSDEAADG